MGIHPRPARIGRGHGTDPAAGRARSGQRSPDEPPSDTCGQLALAIPAANVASRDRAKTTRSHGAIRALRKKIVITAILAIQLGAQNNAPNDIAETISIDP